MSSDKSSDDVTIAHYVNDAPFDPRALETMTRDQEKIFFASQKKLMWWKFKRHKLALWSGIFLMAMYIAIAFCEIIAPYALETRDSRHILAPPQAIHLFQEGELVGPFVYGQKVTLDLQSMKRIYVPDTSTVHKLRFLCSGDSYRFWGLFKADFHLVCPPEGSTLFLLGADRLGRDMLSRIIYGARVSLTIGLIGIVVSFMLGITLGGLAGYYGGWIDLVVQRLIEVIQSLPTIPLWMALAASMPVTWSPVIVYFGITIILGLIDWTGLARAVRSKLLSLREEDYVLAARLMGAGPTRIIGLHLIPGFMSHLIASATITIPSMILGETALSFLGLGLRPPIVSWGVLLNDAQNIGAVAITPWLMWPVVPVILIILAFNFFGDGLRDAADPYN